MRSLLLFALVLTSCAYSKTSPEARVEEASSSREAIEICAKSRIEDDGVVAVASARIWTRCMEMVFRRYKDARENEDLAELFHELSKTEGDPRTSEERMMNAEGMNAAVSASFARILAGLDRRPYSLSSDQMNSIRSNLPGYATYLEALR